ncbi:MAG TPA: glycosyltransferase family 1 protein [Candidatus Magasanikbacteria bacterium]|nr:glycosyltransferase family 1 protein [Candidatus Magasanikbacteria bacterium]
MRLGFDARFYSEAGGLGRYTQELLKELMTQDVVNSYFVFVTQTGNQNYQPTNPNFKKILADIKWYTWREQIYLNRIIKKQKIDLMHFPHWNVPFFYRRPFVVTIHDLILLKFPSRQASTLGWFKYLIKNLSYRLVLRHAIYGSRKILVPTEFVKQDILKNFSVSSTKIKVTGEGITNLPNTPSSPDLLKNLNISQPYFLYVGVAYPHKNLERLVLAFADFQKKETCNFQLVLVGKKNYFYQRLENFIKKNNLSNIVLTDFLPDTDLPTLYHQALAYIFPSLYEGFGLPPLEAMAYNTPVISSNTSCLPEVLGQAALYFNPQNQPELSLALKTISQDTFLRQKLISAGQDRIKLFSWQNCAQLTLQEYSKVV